MEMPKSFAEAALAAVLLNASAALVNIKIEAMRAANLERNAKGEAAAYGELDFMELAHGLLKDIKEFKDSVQKTHGIQISEVTEQPEKLP